MGEEMPHDERYERAEEYMEVVYKLWEHSWADGAVVLDGANDTYADPDRVRRIDHHGHYFSVAGPHHSEPSPQRTPLLAQAGGSPRGSVFAATHAELVFMIATSIADARAATAHLREVAERVGRDAQSVKVMPEISWVVAETEQAARAKAEHYLATADPAGALALLGGLILNLMPCVLPVLSLKFLSVLGHGGRENTHVRLGFLASVAGIVTSFLVLAGVLATLKAAGTTIGWGIQFQQPVFLAIMVVIVTLFAANLFGLFEIILPQKITL